MYDLIRDARVRRLFERLGVTIRALTDEDAATANSGLRIRGLSSRDAPLACYFPHEDAILAPPGVTPDVLLHELIHWTGQANRCERGHRPDGKSYCTEEFVAAGGARLLLERFGYPTDGTYGCNIEPYIKIWAKMEPATLFQGMREAAREARIAVNYIAALAGDALPPEPGHSSAEEPFRAKLPADVVAAISDAGGVVEGVEMIAIGPDGERMVINGPEDLRRLVRGERDKSRDN